MGVMPLKKDLIYESVHVVRTNALRTIVKRINFCNVMIGRGLKKMSAQNIYCGIFEENEICPEERNQ